jgi:acyl-coenzyme A synthetase/AMP-(fatty) acid ligase
LPNIIFIDQNNDAHMQKISLNTEHENIQSQGKRSLSIVASHDKLEQVKEIVDIINRGEIPILFDHAMHSSSKKAYNIYQNNLANDPGMPQDTEIILFTSGTTGNPIGVFKNRENIESEVAVHKKWLSKKNLEQCLVTVPFFHIYGFLFGFSIPMAMDMDIITKEHFLPSEILDICSSKPTLCIANPVFIRSMLKMNYNNYTLTDTLFISSSGPLEAYEAEAFEKKYQTTLVQIYGSSETGGIAKREANETLWTPLEDVEISEIDNILHVDSAFVSHYIYDEKFIRIEHPFKTTEVVKLKDDKFEITGRVVELVKIGGKRLSIIEIERFLEDMDDIDEALVEALYDPKNIRGETLTVYIISRNPDIDKRFIKQSLHDFFGGVHIECKIILCDTIPKTSLGKKIRRPFLETRTK